MEKYQYAALIAFLMLLIASISQKGGSEVLSVAALTCLLIYVGLGKVQNPEG